MALSVIVFVGRMGADPELRYTGSGVAVTSFSVAVDRPFSNGGEKLTDWHSCVAWKNAAENISKYFKKGDYIGVKGRLQYREWTDKEGGKHKTAEVIVEDFTFTASKSQGGGGERREKSAEPGGFHELESSPDGLPF